MPTTLKPITNKSKKVRFTYAICAMHEDYKLISGLVMKRMQLRDTVVDRARAVSSLPSKSNLYRLQRALIALETHKQKHGVLPFRVTIMHNDYTKEHPEYPGPIKYPTSGILATKMRGAKLDGPLALLGKKRGAK